MFIFERLNILRASHTQTSQKLWPFEFIESFLLSFKRPYILCTRIGDSSEMYLAFVFFESLLCSFSSVSIYHGTHRYTQVKSYGRLNLPRAYVFNCEHLDILCTGIGDPSEKLGPFEFHDNFLGSFSSVLKYHGPHKYTRVKSYGRLNLSRASC